DETTSVEADVAHSLRECLIQQRHAERATVERERSFYLWCIRGSRERDLSVDIACDVADLRHRDCQRCEREVLRGDGAAQRRTIHELEQWSPAEAQHRRQRSDDVEPARGIDDDGRIETCLTTRV